MNISVVIATYNGEKYIEEQLNSIRKQSLCPNEIIICDDVSNDSTVEKINEYIEKYSLSNQNWKLYRNKTNKGYIKNFIDAINLSSGDIIFLSDQDDIWDKNKIRKMVSVISKYDAEAVFCLDDYIDAQGKKVKNRIGLCNRIRTNKKVLSINLKQRLNKGRSPGLCLCFSKKIKDDITYICRNYDLPHDLPIGLIAAAHHRYYFLNEVLVHHRIHLNNASTPDTKITDSIGNIERQIKSRKIKQEEFKVVRDKYLKDLTTKERFKIKKAVIVNQQLIQQLENNKPSGFLRCSLRTNSFFNKLLLLRNFLSLIKPN